MSWFRCRFDMPLWHQLRALFTILVFLFLNVTSTLATGTPSSCGAANGWISHLARDIQVKTIPKVCLPDRLVMSLSPLNAPPLAIEIARGSGAAFRYVRDLRVSPVVEVDDFQTLPKAQREAFVHLTEWLAGHYEEVRFEALPLSFATPTSVASKPAPVLLLLALVLWFVARQWLVSVSRVDVVLVLSLFTSSLALRMGLGLWCPIRVNGVGPMWILAATRDPLAVDGYGSGYPEIFGWIARISPNAPDYAIFGANAVISAVAVVLGYSFARVNGLNRKIACLAAAVLAIDPLIIRTAATESYFVGINALVVAASLAFCVAAVESASGQKIRSTCLMLVGSLLCAQAARIHPVAWPLVLLAPTFSLAALQSTQLRYRLVQVLVSELMAIVVIAVTSGNQVLGGVRRMAAGETFQPSIALWGASLALLCTLAVILLLRPARSWLVLASGLTVSIWLLTRASYAQSASWQGSYDSLYLTWLAVGVVASVPKQNQLPNSMAVVVAIFAGVLAWRGVAALGPKTTQQLEYGRMRSWFRALPGDCRVVYVAFVGKKNLFLPTYMSAPTTGNAVLSLDLRENGTLPAGYVPHACDYYIQTSLCSQREAASACSLVEARLLLEPVLKMTLPTVKDHNDQVYILDPVPITISRVVAER